MWFTPLVSSLSKRQQFVVFSCSTAAGGVWMLQQNQHERKFARDRPHSYYQDKILLRSWLSSGRSGSSGSKLDAALKDEIRSRKEGAESIHRELENIINQSEKRTEEVIKKQTSLKAVLEFVRKNQNRFFLIGVAFISVHMSVQLVRFKYAYQELEERYHSTEEELKKRQKLLGLLVTSKKDYDNDQVNKKTKDNKNDANNGDILTSMSSQCAEYFITEQNKQRKERQQQQQQQQQSFWSKLIHRSNNGTDENNNNSNKESLLQSQKSQMIQGISSVLQQNLKRVIHDAGCDDDLKKEKDQYQRLNNEGANENAVAVDDANHHPDNEIVLDDDASEKLLDQLQQEQRQEQRDEVTTVVDTNSGTQVVKKKVFSI